jgi:hypothetical protein
MSNQQQLSRLSILPVNKTVVFYSPIEGRDILVRTGTIAEGSCFFHSLLHAYSKQYGRLDKRGRMKLVTKLRSSLAGKLDKQRWEDMSGGLVAKIPFQENINSMLGDFYKHIEKNRSGKTRAGRRIIRDVIKNKSDTDTYGIITQLVTLDNLEKDILPKAYDESADQKIEECKNVIVKNVKQSCEKTMNGLGDKISSKKKDYCTGKLVKLIQRILDEAEELAFNDYVDNLKDASVSVDSYTIGLISDRFRRDVYFIDSRTRMPYREGKPENIKGRKAIIVMWTGGIHYEVVGRLLPGNRIQREFNPDDPLLKRINTYLYRPENVAEEYPQLVPYLPKDYRNELGFHSSEEESDSAEYESSSEEDSADYSESEDDSDYSEEDSESSHGYEKRPSPKKEYKRSPAPSPKRREHRPERSPAPSPKKERKRSPAPSPKKERKHRPERSPAPSPKKKREHREPKEKHREHREPKEKHREHREPKEKHREHREPKEKHRELF